MKMQSGDAETIAVEALSFLADDSDRLGRFLAVTGVSPAEIRRQAGDPTFLAGVLQHIVEDQRLLLALAERIGCNPERIVSAANALGGAPWERDIP